MFSLQYTLSSLDLFSLNIHYELIKWVFNVIDCHGAKSLEMTFQTFLGLGTI